MVISSGLSWDAKEVNDALISNLRETAEVLLGQEGFKSLVAIRHESLKSDLTKLVFRLKGPQDVLLGATGIDNFTFYKPDGDFQGSVVVYKDKIYFTTSLAYKLEKPPQYYRPEEKTAEFNKLLNDMKDRTGKANLSFFGTTPESFSIGRTVPFTKADAVQFVHDVHGAMSGLKLRSL